MLLRCFVAMLLLLGLHISLTGCAGTGSAGSGQESMGQRELEIRLDLADAYLRNNEPRLALQELMRIEHAGARLPRFHFTMGYAQFVLGNRAAAVEALQKAVALDPDHAEAWNNLGLAYLAADRFADAESAFVRAMHIPTYRTPEIAALNLGLLSMERNDPVAAKKYVNQALDLNWRFNQAYLLAAEIEVGQGDLGAAVDVLRRGVEADMSNARMQLTLAEYLLLAGRNREARIWLERVFDISAPNSSEAQLATKYLQSLERDDWNIQDIPGSASTQPEDPAMSRGLSSRDHHQEPSFGIDPEPQMGTAAGHQASTSPLSLALDDRDVQDIPDPAAIPDEVPTVAQGLDLTPGQKPTLESDPGPQPETAPPHHSPIHPPSIAQRDKDVQEIPDSATIPGDESPAPRDVSSLDRGQVPAHETDPGPQPETAAAHEFSYVVQVGAFLDPSNALAVQGRYKAKGYPAKIVEVPRSGKVWSLVYIGSFSSRDLAKEQARAFRNKEGVEAIVSRVDIGPKLEIETPSTSISPKPGLEETSRQPSEPEDQNVEEIQVSTSKPDEESAFSGEEKSPNRRQEPPLQTDSRPQTDTSATPDSSYIVQIGSFPDQGNALSSLGHYEAKGYPVGIVEVLHMGEVWYVLHMGKFINEESAQEQARAFRNREGLDAIVSRVEMGPELEIEALSYSISPEAWLERISRQPSRLDDHNVQEIQSSAWKLIEKSAVSGEGKSLDGHQEPLLQTGSRPHTDASASPDSSYIVQIGAFLDQSNALSVLGQYEAKGYPAGIVEVLHMGKVWSLLHVGKFSNEEPAQEQARAFRNNEGVDATVKRVGMGRYLELETP